MMKKLILLALLPAFCTAVYAEELNQRTHLPPEVQVKVNKYIAQSYIQGQIAEKKSQQELKNTTHNNDSNANTSGNATNASGSTQVINSISNVRQAPKEVITVAHDIVNICFHCR